MHILLSTDKNYIMPSAVMMKSVSVNNIGESITFHVLIDGGVKDLQKQQLQRIVEYHPNHVVTFHLIEGDLFKDFPQLGKVKKYITQATYYRLFITDYIPEEVNKILYLDGDIIVRHSLSPLWNMDIDNYAIGAVEDMGGEQGQDFSRLGYEKTYRYFNAGMLLINLDYWRKHHLKKKFLELIVNEPQKIVLHDQDVLNIVLYNQKLMLPLTYNFQNGFLRKPEFSSLHEDYPLYKEEILETLSNPVIVHYTDQKKPWHVEDCNPYGYEFVKYYKQTEWRFKPLRHCYVNTFRHYIGVFFRKMKLVPEKVNEESWYYSIDEIL